MKFFKFKYEQCTAEEFVDFWKRFYDEGKYPDEEYKEHLNENGLLERDKIQRLWEWKNGTPLSEKKQPIIERTIEKLPEINRYRSLNEITEDDIRNLRQVAEYITNGFIWQIFVLHMAKPKYFPIFDQHVFRAFKYLTTGKLVERRNYSFDVDYMNYRRHFFELVELSKKRIREVDQALMAFGQYLPNYSLL